MLVSVVNVVIPDLTDERMQGSLYGEYMLTDWRIVMKKLVKITTFSP